MAEITERDEKGRFIVGNKGNPIGRPRKEYLDRVVTEFWNQVPPELMAEYMVKILEKGSVSGSSKALSTVWDRILGKPAQQVNVNGGNGDRIRELLAAPSVLDAVYEDADTSAE